MRINGFSGLDVDSMVKEMMKPYNIKVDKEKQQRDLVGWKQDLYRDITKNMKALHSKYLDVLSKDYILSPNKLSATKATSVDASIVDVSALSGAKNGTYTVKIDKLATTAQVNSDADIKSNGTNTKIDISGLQQTEPTGGRILTFKINGTSKNVIINDNPDGVTVGDLITSINSTVKDLGVQASYSEFSGKVTIETTKTGKSANLNVTGLESIKIGDTATKLFSSTVVSEGTNASFNITLPGSDVAIPQESETNVFTKDNITFNLNKANATTTFTVKNDVSGTVDSIYAFIDDYNKLIDDMYSKVTTPKNKSGEYLPLSDDQKKDMSDDQIKTWEQKGKNGLLKGDMLLNSILSDMRGVFDSYSGIGTELKKSGISLSSDMTKPNHIEIDKDKLKTALENNGENVINMLISTDKTVQIKKPDGKVENYKGAFAQIKDITYESCMKYKSKLVEKAGDFGSTTFSDELGKDIAKRNDKIKQMAKDLKTREQSFYTKFSQLEQAMAKLNAQQEQFSKQFGGA